MKNLENFGVQEMKISEIKKVNGGLFGLDDLALAVAAGIILAVIEDWPNFKAGLTGGKPVKN
jgi:hypothetical protein